MTSQKKRNKQKKGVPMGGKLSYFVAEIYTNHAIKRAIEEATKNRDISFICKYVDDIFMIADPFKIDKIKQSIENEMNGLCIKITEENEERSVRYLDLKQTRINNRKNHELLEHTWTYKEIAFKRMVDYYTTFEMPNKINVYRELYQRSCMVTTKHKQYLVKSANTRNNESQPFPRGHNQESHWPATKQQGNK